MSIHDPHESESIELLFLAPVVFVLCIIIAFVSMALKRKNYTRILFVNAIVAPVLLFQFYFHALDEKRPRIMTFTRADSTFKVWLSERAGVFDLAYQNGPGSTVPLTSGKAVRSQEGWTLQTDSLTMWIISNDRIVGFRTSKDTISLKTVDF